MIRSFTSKDARQIWNQKRSKRFPYPINLVILRKLRMLDAATIINDLRVPPANHLEKLKGDRQGQHSIRINDSLRLCFRFEAGDAYDIEIVDYH